jgi:hypothetical protein
MTCAANTGPRPVHDIPFLDSLTVHGEAADWGEQGFHVRLVGVHEREQGSADEADISVSSRLGCTRAGVGLCLVVRDDEYIEDPSITGSDRATMSRFRSPARLGAGTWSRWS